MNPSSVVIVQWIQRQDPSLWRKRFSILMVDAAGETRARRGRMRFVVGMAQRRDVHRLDLVLAPSEELRPGGIDADEVAVEAGDAEQVFRDHPNPVALARATLDLRFELFAQLTQALL